MSDCIQFSALDEAALKLEGYGSERAVCTVMATSIAFKIPYAHAHSWLEKLGRKRNRRILWTGIANKIPLEMMERIEHLSNRRLISIWPELNHGSFIVRIRRHVFAVVDGVAFDWVAPRPGCIVQMVYKVVR